MSRGGVRISGWGVARTPLASAVRGRGGAQPGSAAAQPRAAAAAQRTHIVVVGRTASRPGAMGPPHTMHVQ